MTQPTTPEPAVPRDSWANVDPTKVDFKVLSQDNQYDPVTILDVWLNKNWCYHWASYITVAKNLQLGYHFVKARDHVKEARGKHNYEMHEFHIPSGAWRENGAGNVETVADGDSPLQLMVIPRTLWEERRRLKLNPGMENIENYAHQPVAAMSFNGDPSMDARIVRATHENADVQRNNAVEKESVEEVAISMNAGGSRKK